MPLRIRTRLAGALLAASLLACVDDGVDPPGDESAGAGASPASPGGPVREGFEDTNPGSVPRGWTPMGYGNRTMAVTDELAARGERSLRIDVEPGQGPVVAMLLRSNLGELSDAHFGRVLVRIEGPGPSEFVHFDVLEATGRWQEQSNAVRLASTGTGAGDGAGSWSWIYNVQPTDYGEFGTEGDRSAHPAVDSWMCLEWQLDATRQSARFWQDGVAIDYLSLDEAAGDRTEIPSMRTVSVGFQKFQETSGFVVFVDEVALSSSRVGCDE